MKYAENPSRDQWERLLTRPQTTGTANEIKVQEILERVREGGDSALRALTKEIEGVELDEFAVPKSEIEQACAQIPEELKRAIRTAIANITKFHRHSVAVESAIETAPGVRCWRKSVGIEKVGLYIPGGTAPLFSTVLMLAIPAKIADCRRIVLCTPAGKEGSIHPAILFAANECGITEIFKAGGAQAIAAMRYGTESIPAVNKIFGPGNSWVTTAKQLIARDGFPIDMPAGPSEVAVFADAGANPAFVAADLLSQAEHGKDSQVVLVSTSKTLIDAVQDQLKVQLNSILRTDIAQEALMNSLAILVDSPETAIDMLNVYAPEHLILNCERAELLSNRVINAGSVFIGPWSPESAGDYASGTNHTLPTNGNARAWSGVSVDSFVKKITFQQLTREGLSQLAGTVQDMAKAEGLQAHANAVAVRMK